MSNHLYAGESLHSSSQDAGEIPAGEPDLTCLTASTASTTRKQLVLGLRDFMDSQIHRFRENHFVLWSFTFDVILHVLVLIGGLSCREGRERRLDFRSRRAHCKLKASAH